MRKYRPALDQEEKASWKCKKTQKRTESGESSKQQVVLNLSGQSFSGKNGMQTCNPATGGRTNTKGYNSKVIQCF